jgi:DNA end-binding protein Ku
MAEPRRAENPEARSPAARAFWSGTISFGLVSIPVALFPATRQGGVALRMLAPSGTPVARRWFCPADEREVPDEEVVRGREVRNGKWVVVTDAELEALEPRKSRDIDLREFVPLEAIPAMQLERAYFLAPTGGSTKAYRLLALILERSGRAGIATFVMREREHLVAILARRGILSAEVLRFAAEVRAPVDVGLPAPRTATPAARRRLERALHGLAARTVPRDALRDERVEAIRALAERKRRRDDDVVRVATPGPAEDEAVDLVATIRASLARRGTRAAAAPARRAGGKRRERRRETRAAGRKRRRA